MLLAGGTVRRIRVLRTGLVVAALSGLVPMLAWGQQADNPEAVEKVTALNKKALEAYESLDFEEARKTLKQALDLAGSSGLDKHPITARTHIHMGVVLIAGLKQRELGLKQFKKAIEIQSDIRVTKSLANPEIEAAFEEAKQGGAGGGSDPGGAATPAPGGREGGGAAPGPGTGAGAAPAPGADGAEGEPGAGEETAEGGIKHRPVSQARRGSSIPITVSIDPSVTGYEKVVLAYRPEGSEDYLARDMQRSGDSFAAEIPAAATNGNLVTYYVEAEAADESVVAFSGSEEKPYTISLRAPAAAAPSAPCEDDDEDCDDAGALAGPRLFVALAGGVGYGYATGYGEVDVQHRVSPAGFAPFATREIAPEIGYMISPRFRLSVQLRYQLVSGATEVNLARLTPPKMGCGSDNVCSPATSALAVLARGSWFFGQGKARPYFLAAVGAGQVRHLVKFSSMMDCGPDGGEVCVDTVLAGPVFAGPGGGIFVALVKNFGLMAELTSLVGFPKFTFQLDLHGGVAARF